MRYYIIADRYMEQPVQDHLGLRKYPANHRRMPDATPRLFYLMVISIVYY
jgi:hypothetical protein